MPSATDATPLLERDPSATPCPASGERVPEEDRWRRLHDCARRSWRGRVTARLGSRTAAAFTPWLALVACLCVGLPVLACALSGGLSIPHNDAWSMSRIAETFGRSGQIHLLGWNDMNLIGQVVMLGPLGSSLVVQQLSVAVLSVACLLCVYRLLAVSLRTRDAVLGAALLGTWPGWASLSTSFETDVPAFAATFAALLLGRRALMRDSVGWLIAAWLISLWAVSIREQAIVAPLAILIYGWLTRRSRQRVGGRALRVATAGGGLLLAGFEVWRWALPSGQDPGPSAGLVRFAGDLVTCGSTTYLTVALGLAPAVLTAAARHRWTRQDRLWLGVGLALAVLALLCGGIVGRYLEASGEYSQVLPGTRLVIPHDAWDTLLALAVVSGTLLVPVARPRWRSVDPLLALFTILSFLEIVIVGASGNGVSDRYLPALLPGTLALVLGPASVRSRAHQRGSSPMPGAGNRVAAAMLRALALIGLVFLTAVSAALAANGFAFDAARWHGAQRLVQTGVPSGRIDAGLEWDGWHSPHGMLYGHAQSGRPGGWSLAFYRTPACRVLSSSPLRTGAGTAGAAGPAGARTAPARWTPAGSFAYRTFLITGRSQLYWYDTHASGCERPERVSSPRDSPSPPRPKLSGGPPEEETSETMSDGSAAKSVLSGLNDELCDLESLYKDIHSHPELWMRETRAAEHRGRPAALGRLCREQGERHPWRGAA